MNYNIFTNQNKWQKWVFAVIRNIILAVLIAFLLGWVFGYKYLNILTDSMNPTMPRGTLIVIHSKNNEDIKVGDVATYSHTGNTFVTHRIVEVDYENGCVYTRGDAEPEDAKVDQVKFSEIEGIVIAYFPGLGSFFNNIRQNILIIVGFIVLVYFVLQYV